MDRPLLTTDEASAATAQRFLTALHGAAPSGRLLLWAARSKQAVWPASIPEAASAAVRLARRDEVYFGVGLRRAVPRTGRGSARDVLSLPALWADLDVKAAHKPHDLPPDRAAAMAILGDFPLPASAVVAHGYGYQAYWLLDTPYMNDDVRHTKELLTTLGQSLAAIAERHGWRIDTGVFEPARVLRLPGTYNRKARRPIPVRIERLDGGARYDVDQLLAVAESASVAGGHGWSRR